MKTWLIILVLSTSAFVIPACEKSPSPKISDSGVNEAGLLVDEINNWDLSELIQFARPEKNRVTAGETCEWIRSRIDKLNEMGFDVSWNESDCQFELIQV